MPTGPLENLQFQVTPEERKRLEQAAASLNLTLSAYILYLQELVRLGPGADRMRRMVREVFGRHGELIRRLAK
jgi:hypothetical protein